MSIAVTGDISDLFFNLDFEDCKTYTRGPAETFKGFDHDKLRERAKWFSDTFHRATSLRVDVDALVRDFYDRV